MKQALAFLGTVAAVGLVAVGLTNPAEARDEIRIVGSSTVFPFATATAEEFGKVGGFVTPVVESTGTGGGIKLFCEGVGTSTPDIANASRRIKKGEVETCSKNGVFKIHEVKVGYDGIVLAHLKSAAPFELSREQIWKALAKDVLIGGKWVPNPYKNWSDIDSSLPKQKIEVLGPPPTSGTRDAFNELALEGGCSQDSDIAAIKKEDEKRFKSLCHTVREDGAFIEAGENDNLIVQKIKENPSAIGVFGYSFLDQNRDTLVSMKVDGVEPTYDDISSGKYPVSRTLYFYVKMAHMGVIPGIKEYIDLWLKDSTFGPDGFLAEKGLIALPDADREIQRKSSADAEALKL